MTSEDNKETILAAIEANAEGNPDYIFGFGFDYNAQKEDGTRFTTTFTWKKIK